MRKNRNQLLAATLSIALGISGTLGGYLVTPAATVSAEDSIFQSEDQLYRYEVLADGTISLLSFYGDPVLDESDPNNSFLYIQIPDTIDGKTVTGIAGSLLKDNPSSGTHPVYETTTLILPNTLRTLDTGIFETLLQLTEIQISDENTAFTTKDGILYNKDLTTLIYVPSCVQGTDGALTEYTVPDSVTTIAKDALSNCNSLTNITIPASVSKIESPAFMSDISRANSLMSITVAEDNPYFVSDDGILFSKDKKTLIRYPAGKAQAVFSGDYSIPDGVEAIAEGAFQNTTYFFGGLFDIQFPASLKVIGNSAFASCDMLGCFDDNGLVIPDGVTTIGDNAFFDCVSLSKIVIPDSVKEIGASAFAATNPHSSSVKSLQLGNGVQTIGKEAFLNQTSLTELTLPDSLESIDDFAFFGCVGIKAVTLPRSLNSIGKYALGYYYSTDDTSQNVLTGVEDFTITAYAGTKGAEYANDNNFTIDIINDPTPTPAVTPTATPVPTNPPAPSDTPTPSDAPDGTAAPSNNNTVTPPVDTSVTQKPSPVKLISVKNKKSRKATVTWKKGKSVSGYQIQYSTSSKFKNAKKITIKKSTTTKATLKKLKKKKTYYVRIRTYRKGDSKTVYSTWSSKKKVKIKK